MTGSSASNFGAFKALSRGLSVIVIQLFRRQIGKAVGFSVLPLSGFLLIDSQCTAC